MGGFLYGFLIFIEIVSALLLIGIILLQKTKDEGLGLAFGAGVGETLFGSRTGNVLTKITVTLAGIFLLNTLAIGYIASGRVGTGSVIDRLPVQQSVPTQSMPAQAAPVEPAAVDIPAASGDVTPVQTPATTTP
ncbi:MAG: preprotein translocase subunit SecG [bacterium]|jgi:preprotein translocase subunit SecG